MEAPKPRAAIQGLAAGPYTDRPYDDELAAHVIDALYVSNSWHVEQPSSVPPAMKVFTLLLFSPTLAVAMPLTPRTSTIQHDITSDASFSGPQEQPHALPLFCPHGVLEEPGGRSEEHSLPAWYGRTRKRVVGGVDAPHGRGLGARSRPRREVRAGVCRRCHETETSVQEPDIGRDRRVRGLVVLQ
jgi:hypothetical protein